MNFERVEYLLKVISDNHFMKRLAIEQLLYKVMVGEGDGMYHVLLGDDNTTYVRDFIRLLIKVCGCDNVSYLDYNELSVGSRSIRDSDKLVIGASVGWDSITDRNAAVLKYLVDNEPMYIKPVFAKESGRMLNFNGIVVQKGSDSFIDGFSAGLRRRTSVLQFSYVDAELKEDFDMDKWLIEELKSYLRVKYGS